MLNQYIGRYIVNASGRYERQDDNFLVPAYMRIRQYVMGLVHKSGGKSEKIKSVRELSRLFNVSHLTVMKALRQLIDEDILVCRRGMGTFINPERVRGQDILGAKPSVIGIVVSSGMLIHHDFFYLKLLSSVYDALADELVLARNVNIAGTGKNAVDELASFNLDGILWVNPCALHVDTVKELDAADIPFVAVDMVSLHQPKNVVRLRLLDEGYAIAEYFFKLGREKILFVDVPDKDRIYEQRLDGFKKAYADYGKNFDPRLVISQSDGVSQKLQGMLAFDAPFDAIFANGNAYRAVRDSLDAAGNRSVRDIVTLTEETSPAMLFARERGEPLTRLSRPLKEIGEAAAKTLIRLVRKEIESPIETRFEWTIKTGNVDTSSGREG